MADDKEELDRLLAEGRDFAERMTSQPWACELIERLVEAVDRLRSASAIERLSAIEQERDALREALRKVKEAIESPLNKFAVADTIWMLGEPYPNETLLDFIDVALNQTRTDASEATDGH